MVYQIIYAFPIPTAIPFFFWDVFLEWYISCSDAVKQKVSTESGGREIGRFLYVEAVTCKVSFNLRLVRKMAL